MEAAPKDNVVPLKPQFGLFTQALRSRLEDGVRPHLHEPEQAAPVIKAVELVICAFMVEVARRVAVSIGKKLGAKLSGK